MVASLRDSSFERAFHQGSVTHAGLGCPGSGPELPADVVDLVRKQLPLDAAGARDWLSLAMCSKQHWQRAQTYPPPAELSKLFWVKRACDASAAQSATESLRWDDSRPFLSEAVNAVLTSAHYSALARECSPEVNETVNTWDSLRLQAAAYRAHNELTNSVGRVREIEKSLHQSFPVDAFRHPREIVPSDAVTLLQLGTAGFLGWKLTTFAVSSLACSFQPDPLLPFRWDGFFGAGLAILGWVRTLEDPAHEVLLRLNRHFDKDRPAKMARHAALLQDRADALREVNQRCQEIIAASVAGQESNGPIDAA